MVSQPECDQSCVQIHLSSQHGNESEHTASRHRIVQLQPTQKERRNEKRAPSSSAVAGRRAWDGTRRRCRSAQNKCSNASFACWAMSLDSGTLVFASFGKDTPSNSPQQGSSNG